MQKYPAENLITPEAADRLISAHDSDVALLYIYYLRKGHRDPERAAADLCRTLGEINAADEKLSRLGLFSPAPVRENVPVIMPVTPEGDDRPQYTAQEIVRRTMEDPQFGVILDECAKLMGHTVGSSDTRTLFGIYEHLGMPFEVFLMLLNYCAELNREKYKGQRKLTAYFIEREANRWAQNEIFTVEQADEFVRRSVERRQDIESLASMLGIHDRPLAKSVHDMLGGWLNMGFGEAEIMLAYDRSMLRTSGKLSLNYMNGIIKRWNDNGLKTLREINEKDPPRSGANNTRTAPDPRKSQQIDLGKMRDILDKI